VVNKNEMKKVLILAALGIVVLVVCKFVLETNNPVIIGEKITKLDIPQSAKVVRFERESNEFNGDGYILIELSLNDLGVQEVERQCINNRYLPLSSSFFEKEVILQNFNDKNDRGYYKLVASNKNTHSVSLLNKSKETLVIYSVNR
jgi:hypothetical protein